MVFIACLKRLCRLVYSLLNRFDDRLPSSDWSLDSLSVKYLQSAKSGLPLNISAFGAPSIQDVKIFLIPKSMYAVLRPVVSGASTSIGMNAYHFFESFL